MSIPTCVACGAAHHPAFPCRIMLREAAQAYDCGRWSYANDADNPYPWTRPELRKSWEKGYRAAQHRESERVGYGV